MVNGPGELPIQAAIVQPPSAPIPTEAKVKVDVAPVKAQPVDKIELSPKAREVQTLVAKVQSEPEIRADKVAEIKTAISQNRDIPAAKVAEKLLMEG